MKYLVKRKKIDENTVEKLMIPVGDPPVKNPSLSAQSDLENLKKLAELKAPLLEKAKFPNLPAEER